MGSDPIKAPLLSETVKGSGAPKVATEALVFQVTLVLGLLSASGVTSVLVEVSRVGLTRLSAPMPSAERSAMLG
jgi:hypothetical protein